MTIIPFAGQSYSDKTLNANAQEAINLYPMKTTDAQYSDKKVSGAAPEKIIMYPTPGYKWQKYLASGEIRGFYEINDTLYIVAGSSLIICNPIGGNSNLNQAVFTTVGTLNTTTGVVSIECNTVQLAISDGQFGYTYNLSTAAFALITGGAWPASGGVTNFTFFDGYILGAINNSSTVIQSNVLDATTFGAQAFDTITSFPDNINAVFSDELQLYIMGPKITEVQADAGSIPYAFQKVPNVLIQAGLASALAWSTIKKVANTFFFLAADIAGKAYVAALSSYDTKVISTPPINEQIQRYAIIADAYSWVYREGDNHFYMITFPSEGVTWGYDIKTDLWHKRSINGGADLPTACILWKGMQVVGDKQGSLYVMSQDYTTYGVYNKNTKTVSDYLLDRTRTTAHLNAEGKTMFIHELWVDLQVGSGFIADADLAYQPYISNTPAIIQAKFGFGSTTQTATITSSQTGNLIAVYANLSGTNATVTGVTDSAGQVYIQVPGAYGNSTVSQRGSDIWYFPNSIAGVTNVTATIANPRFSSYIEVVEISNLATSNVVDSAGSVSNGVPSTSPASFSLSTNEKSDYIFVGLNSQESLTYFLPYSKAVANSNNQVATTYVPNSIITNQSAVFGTADALSYCSSSVAFKTRHIESPLATLYVSKDFGRTWINVGTRSLGARGQTMQRVIWRNIGRFRQVATFMLKITDPVGAYILGAKANIKLGIK